MIRVSTPQEILGVGPNATPDEIKAAFRRLVLEAHPDKHPGDAEAEARFRCILEAYQTLSTGGTPTGDRSRRKRKTKRWSDADSLEGFIRTGAKVLTNPRVQSILLDVAKRGLKTPVIEVVDLVRDLLMLGRQEAEEQE